MCEHSDELPGLDVRQDLVLVVGLLGRLAQQVDALTDRLETHMQTLQTTLEQVMAQQADRPNLYNRMLERWRRGA